VLGTCTSYSGVVTPGQQSGHIDLFDDPAWDSAEGRQEALFYERMSGLGLASWVESTVSVFAILAFAAWVVACITLLWVVNNLLAQIMTELGQGLKQLANSMHW
jgi:hypothetical protein